MKAERELDALVAEKVMGLNILGITSCVHHHFWYVQYDGQGQKDQPVYLRRCVCYIKEVGATIILGHISACLDVVPFYSTDISSAWQVVDKIEELGFILFPLERRTPLWLRYRWSARFVTSDDPVGLPLLAEEGFIGEGETPAAAICYAALKVVGYDPDRSA